MSLLHEARQCIANQAAHKALNAFVSLRSEAAILGAVEDATAGPSSASARSPLAGRLVAVKDNICTSGLPTTSASGVLSSFTSPYDATVVRRLQDAGAVVVGKTNLDEFGMGSHSTHSRFGAVRQLQEQDREGNGGKEKVNVSAGGSSGGSAVAVKMGMCWAALGTDTGGSVRLPAAYTGIVGFKPSYGLISRWGVVAYANSLDTVGIMARDSKTAGLVFSALSAHDPLDPTSLPPSTRQRLASTRASRSSLRIGIPLEYNITSLSPRVLRAWKRTLQHLQSLGHTLHPVSLPATKAGLAAYYVLAPAEAASNLARFDGVRFGSRSEGADKGSEEGGGGGRGVLYSRTRGAGFGDEVKRRILLGSYTLSADAVENYFVQAQRVRRVVQRGFDGVFGARNPLHGYEYGGGGAGRVMDGGGDGGGEGRGTAEKGEGVDILVCPTAPTLPPSLAELKAQAPVDAYMNDVFTVPASLAGLPAVSVPVRTRDESTVGIQVVAQFGDDEVVLRVAGLIEKMDG